MFAKINPFFLRIFAILMAFVCIFSVAIAIISCVSFDKIKDLAVENTNIDFLDDARDFERVLGQVKYSLGEFSSTLVADRGFDDASYIEGDAVRTAMRTIFADGRQNEFSKYMMTVFVRDLMKDDVVYELTGAYESDVFFNQYYVSERYTDDFWRSQILQEKAFEVYSADMFSASREARKVDARLIPVSYKPTSNNRFIVVAMLDADKISEDFGISEMLSLSGDVIYRASDVGASAYENTNTGIEKTEDGYAFKLFDKEAGLCGVVRVIGASDVFRNIRGIGLGISMVFILFFITGILMTVFVGLKYSAPLSEMAEGFEKNQQVKAKLGSKVDSLYKLRDSARVCLACEVDYIPDADNKESVLNSLFLQSRMRDVYTGIDNIENYIKISKSFLMMYLRVNYKEEFSGVLGADTGKATFFLKQLIELYLNSEDFDSTVLQIENNGIVAVFNVTPDFDGQEELARSILLKLENESEYACFTVVVSNVHNDIENLKTVYDNLIDISKYQKPIMETQILFEHDGNRGAGRFYFSLEDMGKLSAVMQNGSEDEALRKFEEIVDYNIKKDINGFELYLLCTEIVNCSVKLVNRVFPTTPSTLDVSAVYKKLNRAHTPEKCKDICRTFLRDIIEYIRQNKREDDYIISYILDYVDEHYSEDIYLNLFAEKLKLTGAYISSYFKEKMNVNLSDYVNNYRIKKALELSANPQNKNKDIAVMVGLPNINTFIRLFKKYTGYTPGEYRKKHFGDGYNK